MFRRLALAAVFAVTALPALAQPIETQAKQAFIVDIKTGAVLLEKNADEVMPPSSMSKMMTAHMLFEKLQKGEIKLTDEFPVSERAWRMQGSKMFVPLNGKVKVEDLIRGIVIQSGNDACIVVAEGLAGSEEAFAEQMTKRARARPHQDGVQERQWLAAPRARHHRAGSVDPGQAHDRDVSRVLQILRGNELHL